MAGNTGTRPEHGNRPVFKVRLQLQFIPGVPQLGVAVDQLLVFLIVVEEAAPAFLAKAIQPFSAAFNGLPMNFKPRASPAASVGGDGAHVRKGLQVPSAEV